MNYNDDGNEAIVDADDESYRLELRDRDGNRRQYEGNRVDLTVDGDEARLRIGGDDDTPIASASSPGPAQGPNLSALLLGMSYCGMLSVGPRVEQRLASNNLRKAVFFNRLGQIRDRAYESRLHRARGLNLLVAAIVLWNSRYLGEAVLALRRHGCDVPDHLLAHVWPLAWDHLNLTGDYTWSGDGPRDPDRLRDLRLDRLTPPLPLQRAA